MGHPRLLDHKVAGDLILRDYCSDPEVCAVRKPPSPLGRAAAKAAPFR